MYKLNKFTLYVDLLKAFNCTKKHKSKKSYIIEYEKNLHSNLINLRDRLLSGTYKPGISNCFIIKYPKKREVFAANFEDRIVHHLYFNYTHKLFENTFIYDTYSCIENRGTHFGIERCKKQIIQCSENYTKKAYCLKMDISGYFMHINRNILKKIVYDSLMKMAEHSASKSIGKLWKNIIDIDFLVKLGNCIITYNPILNCEFKSKKKDWDDLPKDKSLFYVAEGCGLPIGNLTSQLFSNVYLNRLDQFVKRELKCKYYGRYVDDFYIIDTCKARLHNIAKRISEFLKKELLIEVNQGKTTITDVKYGVEFLGGYIKPYRNYISNQSLRRIKRKIYDYDRYGWEDTDPVNSVNSYLGIFSHYSSFKIRKQIFDSLKDLSKYGRFNESYTKFIPYEEE